MTNTSFLSYTLLPAISVIAFSVVAPLSALAQTAPATGTVTAPAETGAAPTTSATSEMAKPAPEMQAVLDKLAELGAKPLHTLTVDQARAQPTPADAVAALMADEGINAGPAAAIATRDIVIPGPAGEIMARVYTPAGTGPFPIIVYYHGGGWVIADLDTYDASARALALGANAVVVASHYRQGPEHKFPAAHEDAYAAYVWVVENSDDFNGDASRIAVAGESAGGNLAANVAIMARDAEIIQPLHQLLVYPVAGNDMNTPSYIENAEAAPLGKADMAWFVEHAFSATADATDPRINLVDRDDLADLPPATVITAQIDPLRSESIAYGEALKAAGGEVEMKNFDGATHEFFGMGAVVPQAVEAVDFATARLKAAVAPTSFTTTAQTGDVNAEAGLLETEVNFTSVEGTDLGMAQLVGTPSGLLIRLELRGLPADEWVAFHIHEGEECNTEGNFESAGGHWNESDVSHGYLSETGSHSGDMPNMYVRSDGRLLADVFNMQAFLTGETGNIIGRTLIFHAGADDYRTQPSGDSGDRLACAVIE